MKIVVEKGNIVKQRFTLRDSGKELTKVIFPARNEEKGVISCMTFGDDKEAIVRKLQETGEEIEVEASFDDRFNQWKVRFPASVLPQRQPRGQQHFTGYRGLPVSFDLWLRKTMEVTVQAVHMMKDIPEMRALSADVLAEQVRALVSQYWICVERNVTYPEGCEPPVQQVAQQNAPAPEEPRQPEKPQSPIARVIENTIMAAETQEAVTAVEQVIRQNETLTAEEKANFLKLCMQKKKAIATV